MCIVDKNIFSSLYYSSDNLEGQASRRAVLCVVLLEIYVDFVWIKTNCIRHDLFELKGYYSEKQNTFKRCITIW